MKEEKEKNGWLKQSQEEKNKIYSFCDDYIKFLNDVKTEREAVCYIVDILVCNGFKNIDDVKTLNFGDKVYFVNKNKCVYASVIGYNSIINGLNIIGAHIDSPRLDLKPNPIYEDLEQTLFKTHYYGGIKKYQWTCIPLSMRGVVVKNDGTTIMLNVGEKADDPIFTITDLLPHLAIEQNRKSLNNAIEGESLNILIGNIPLNDNEGSKQRILNILKENYNILETDFLSAEIEFVPAFCAKSLGFDKSMIAGYGQDDRVCVYTCLKALLEVEKPRNTCVGLFVDKEEIGSYGNTSMMSDAFDMFIIKMLTKLDVDSYLLNEIFYNSKMLSADVGVAIDSTYKEVSEINNASFIGHGVELNKYTGSHGKSGASDANAEYLAEIRSMLETNNITYQISELGKVDLGGGGTVAFILANKGIDVVDCGIPILSMHSPYEVASKFDIYMAYKTYKAFYLN